MRRLAYYLGRALCSQGYHKWRLRFTSDVRMINLPGPASGGYICTIKEGCARKNCHVTRTRRNAQLPKRIKT